MNYYFLLKNNIKHIQSEIDIINFSPSKVFSQSKSEDSILHYFYSNGEEWIFKDLCNLPKDQTFTINENYFENELEDKSIFFSINKKKLNNQKILIDENYHISKIAWKANIKIKFKDNYTSYQGEYPSTMTKKKVSLVSCSPMIQNNKNIKNYFYLVNLVTKPQINNFKINILNSNKQKLATLNCKTNTINFFDLNDLNIVYNKNMYIFQSTDGGGIPIYFSIDSNGQMSLEHTHPPTEYTLHGNRFFFQKLKKNFWKL